MTPLESTDRKGPGTAPGSKARQLKVAGTLGPTLLRVLAGVSLCLAAWGCPPPPAPPEDPPTTHPADEVADRGGPTLRATIHPDLPDYSFTLRGEPDEPGQVYRVETIEIRRGAEAEPVQVIEGLETETPTWTDGPGPEVLDMNFDGYGDLRIIEFTPAGPNTPYLNWLFDPASGQFVRSPELDQITSAEFDPETGRIRSEWRDGAASYGTDVYAIVEGKPVVVRKERKEYSDHGTYHWTVSELVAGEWKVIEDKTVEEAVSPPAGGETDP